MADIGGKFELRIYPRNWVRPKPSDAIVPEFPIYRFTIRQFERMVEHGVLGKDDRVELFDGWIVPKYSQSPPHCYKRTVLESWFREILGAGWWILPRSSLVVGRSVFEPDLMLLREGTTFGRRWPRAKEASLVIEIADIEVPRDCGYKLARYAGAGVTNYWIVNIPDRRVEVYSKPEAGRKRGYRKRTDYVSGDLLPLVLDGKKLGAIAVSELKL